MPLLGKPSRPRPTFRTLRVVEVERLTEEAVAIRFGVPVESRSAFAFEPGQHLTLRAQIAGEQVRRSYSICDRPLPPDRLGPGSTLRIGAARVEGGRMSTWLNDVVRVGDPVDVLPPLGSFTVPVRPLETRHHLAVAAGSGITPVLSHVSTFLYDEPRSRVTLVYGNRSTRSTMFRDELRGLEAAHPDRFRLVEVLSREATDDPLRHGRLDRSRLEAILDALPQAPVDEWYLCGPFGLVTGAQGLLLERGVAPSHVHHEIFHQPA